MTKQLNVTLSETVISKLETQAKKTGARNIQEVLRRIIGEFIQFTEDEASLKARVFIEHIQSHLPEGEQVCCKICGKTVDEIWEELGHG